MVMEMRNHEMIQVFVLTYNRPRMVVNTIKSILAQTYSELQIVVSDNSTNDETKMLIQEKFNDNPRIIYRKRFPSIPPIDHFNKVLSEVSAEYFMLFHDDDTMHPQMLQVLYEQIVDDETVAAVGANAKVIQQGKSKKLFRKKNADSTYIDNRSELVEHYFGQHGCVPFPSYIYRRDKLDGVHMEIEKGGKYCDVSFLMSVCDRGKIIWLNAPLMDYYIHKGQDSKSDVFSDRLKLIGHITSTTKFRSTDKIIKAFRLINIYGELKNQIQAGRRVSLGRIFKAAWISFFTSPTKALPRMMYLSVLIFFVKPTTCK